MTKKDKDLLAEAKTLKKVLGRNYKKFISVIKSMENGTYQLNSSSSSTLNVGLIQDPIKISIIKTKNKIDLSTKIFWSDIVSDVKDFLKQPTSSKVILFNTEKEAIDTRKQYMLNNPNMINLDNIDLANKYKIKLDAEYITNGQFNAKDNIDRLESNAKYDINKHKKQLKLLIKNSKL